MNYWQKEERSPQARCYSQLPAIQLHTLKGGAGEGSESMDNFFSMVSSCMLPHIAAADTKRRTRWGIRESGWDNFCSMVLWLTLELCSCKRPRVGEGSESMDGVGWDSLWFVTHNCYDTHVWNGVGWGNLCSMMFPTLSRDCSLAHPPSYLAI